MNGTVAAIDLGATSGRVVLGHISATKFTTEVVARFPNQPIRTVDGLHWDVLGLFQHALDGLGAALRLAPDLVSVGIDSWAVDYGLFRGGRLLGNPYHYRDERTSRGVEATHQVVGHDRLYGQNGLQFLPFNTLYQLGVDRLDGLLELADTFLLIPDLLTFWMTGRPVCESTNASTTGLVDLAKGSWNLALMERLGIPSSLFPGLLRPGEVVGRTLPAVSSALCASDGVDVVTVGSHDTASAVAAVPMDASDAAYISCGTWGLVGVELEMPVLTEASRLANFTNELGVDGRIRFLQNVMGLWLLNESVRTWEQGGGAVDLGDLMARASAVDTPISVFDVNDPRFLFPGDMPGRIAAYCSEHDVPVPENHAELARSIIESLAYAFSGAIRAAMELSGRCVSTVHLVGGGALNPLLCQLTADHVGIDVVAGPVEATAVGNILVQARAAGFVAGDLDTMRSLVAASAALTRYTPREGRTVELHVVVGLEGSS